MVVAACVVFGLLGCLYAEMSPYAEAPDEPAHADLIFHLAEGGSFGHYDDRFLSRGVVRFCEVEIASTRICPTPGEDTMHLRSFGTAGPSDLHRLTFEDYGGDAPDSRYPNQMTHHSPLYYELMASVLRGERAIVGHPMSMDHEWALLRFANALLMAPIPLIAWWAARRLQLGAAAARSASLLPFVSPQLLHIGSVLGVESLLIPLAGVVVALCCGVMRGERRRRTSVLIGVTLGLALLAKPLALVLVPLVIGSYLIGHRRPFKTSLARLLLSGGACVAVAGWWYVGNLVSTGSPVPTIGADQFVVVPGGTPDTGTFASHFTRFLVWRYWGWFGWYSQRISWPLVIVASALSLGAIWVFFRRAARHTGGGLAAEFPVRRGVGPVTRSEGALLLLPMALLLAFVAAFSWTLYRDSGQFPFIQGRYLYAGLVGLWLVVAAGLTWMFGPRSFLVVAAWGAVMQVDAISVQLTGYWDGDGAGIPGDVDALIAWSAWSTQAFEVFAILLTIAIVLLGTSIRAAAGAPDLPPPPEIGTAVALAHPLQ